MTARVHAACAPRKAAGQGHVPHADGTEEWPTTLRFSRRLGESVRDADYAAWIEGPGGRRSPPLEPRSGLAQRLARLVGNLRRSIGRA